MGRRLRVQRPERIYHVTNKCAEDRLWLRPGKRLNALVEHWLARALRIYKVELLGYLFMGNHFHMLVRAPLCNLHGFMGYFQCNLAKAIHKLRGTRGSVFPRRFRSEAVLDDEAADAVLRYVLLNPVRAGLVARGEQWPGCSSLPQMLGTDARPSLPITPLDGWRGLSCEARAARVRGLIDGGARGARAARRARRAPLGAKRVCRMPWRWRPSRPARSPQPWCHCSCDELRRAYLDDYAERRRAYTVAVLRWRQGKSAVFPAGTVPPGWLRCVEEPTARS